MAVSQSSQDVYWWPQGLVKILSEGPSDATDRDVEETCKKMYQNLWCGQTPRHVEGLEEKIQEVKNVFNKVKRSPNLDEKLSILATRFFLEISEVSNIKISSKYKEHLFNNYLPKILEAFAGTYLIKQNTSESYLKNYLLSSSKNLEILEKDQVKKFSEEKKTEFRLHEFDQSVDLFNKIHMKKVPLQDLEVYIQFLIEHYIKESPNPPTCPDSMQGFHKEFTTWEANYFHEDTKQFWQDRVAILSDFFDNTLYINFSKKKLL